MRIENREQLKFVLQKDREKYRQLGYKNWFIGFVMNNDVSKLAWYMRTLRYEEYWLVKSEAKRISPARLLCLFYRSRRQLWGGRIGVFVPPGTTGYGFQILHSGNVIVNERAVIGNDCTCAGMNCIGVDDVFGNNSHFPIIGDRCFIGVGAQIIGKARIADDCIVAAGAVVNREFEEPNAVLAGIPAAIKKLRTAQDKK